MAGLLTALSRISVVASGPAPGTLAHPSYGVQVARSGGPVAYGVGMRRLLLHIAVSLPVGFALVGLAISGR